MTQFTCSHSHYWQLKKSFRKKSAFYLFIYYCSIIFSIIGSNNFIVCLFPVKYCCTVPKKEVVVIQIKFIVEFTSAIYLSNTVNVGVLNTHINKFIEQR